MFFLVFRDLAGPDNAGLVHAFGVGTFVLCVAILLFGRRIERTLEILNWILVVAILGTFLVLALMFVAPETWVAGAAGLVGYDPVQGAFRFLPAGADFFLIGAFAAYSGAGGMTNLTLSNWARDKGYGMGSVVGYIPAAVGGRQVRLAPTGYIFDPTPEAMGRWRGWWRIVRADQWGVYFGGALLGMILPAVLYVTFIEGGTDIRGLSVCGGAWPTPMATPGGRALRGRHRPHGRLDPVQDPAGHRRRNDARHHRHPCGPVPGACGAGAEAMCASSTTRCSWGSPAGGSSAWGWRSRSCCCSWARTWRGSSS